MSIGENKLAPLGLNAEMSATDAAIQKKIHVSRNKTLIISNNDLNDLIKLATALEEHDIFLKGTTKTIKNNTKKQKGGFLGASLLGNLLTGKGLYRTGKAM